MTMLARLLAMLLLLTGLGLVTADPASAAGRPSAPRAVTAAPGDSSATVTWTAPARKGGSTIRRYGVQRRSGTSWTTVATVSGRTLTWRATGLANGTPYEFRVRARGKAGWGRPSAGVQVAPRTVPGAPGAPEADSYAAALGAYWKAPASNGAPIDYYRVETSTNGSSWTLAVDAPTPGTSASPVMLSGLVPGTRYWVRIRAHNAAGFGDIAGTGPYTARTPPGAPTGLTATPGDGSVALTWVPSAIDAPGETSAGLYRVEQSVDGGASWTVAGEPTDPALAVGELTNGIEHLFRVSARSTTVRVGFGPASATVAATPTGPAGPPPYVLSVPADGVTLDEGTTTTFEVGLGFAALTDTVVSLASSDPSASVDATVTVPAGSSSAMVSVTAAADEDGDDEAATITATLGVQQRTVAVAVHDTTQALVVDPARHRSRSRSAPST